MSEFDDARKHMVDSQIRPSDVTDRRVIAAFSNVPRHAFTPRSRLASAYADSEVETGEGRRMMRPRALSKLVHEADVQADELVLDIACGRGYSTAILARLAETVVALEDDEARVTRATDILADVGADNAAVIQGDLAKGAPGQGPFNVIFVNGGVEEVPQAWFDQLAEGGRLAVIERDGPVGRAMIYTKSGAGVSAREVFDATPAMLPGFAAPRRFAL